MNYIFCWHQASSSTSRPPKIPTNVRVPTCRFESSTFSTLNLKNQSALAKRAMWGSGIEYPPRRFSYHRNETRTAREFCLFITCHKGDNYNSKRNRTKIVGVSCSFLTNSCWVFFMGGWDTTYINIMTQAYNEASVLPLTIIFAKILGSYKNIFYY